MSIIPPHPPSPPKKQSRRNKAPTSKGAVCSGNLITTDEVLRLRTDSIGVNKLRISAATPSLPPSFFSLFTHLRQLDLRRVGLEVLPPQIIALENLQRLDLRYNNLTYLPSQVAQLPNLHQLHIEDLRDRKTRLIKEDSGTTEVDDPIIQYECTCKDTADQKIPPIPTLAQLCSRIILSSIPATGVGGADEISWQDLEPVYSSGKFKENHGDIIQQLPFPSHLLPQRIPIDLCSACSEICLPIHAQFDRIQVVALCKVRLRYIFCSHGCFSKVIEEWDSMRTEETNRKQLRLARFHLKDHSGEEQ
jgi:hypothetical protein